MSFSEWLELCEASALNLHLTLKSGQVFIWSVDLQGVWSGAIDSFPVQLKEESGRIFVKLQNAEKQLQRVKDYFQLSYNMEELYEDWKSRDTEFFKLACNQNFQGLRILRQDPLECLFSFIVSQNNNLKRISSILVAIRKSLGKQISEHPEIHAFPEISDLIQVSEAEYQKLGLGYRAKYFRSTALALQELGGRDFLLGLRDSEISYVRECLLKFPGVGRKVADCVSLFSLDFRSLVPCDTHVLSLAQKRMKTKEKIKTPKNSDHDAIQEYFVSVFGPFAGWAHSLLFVARLAEFRDSASVSNSLPPRDA